MKNALIRLSLLGLFTLMSAGCQQSAFHRAFAGAIEYAQNKRVYDRAQAVAADVEFMWGSDSRFKGVVLYATGSTRAKLVDPRGITTVCDGKNVYVSPAEKASPEAAYLAHALPCFLAAPFKLSDDDIVLTDADSLPFYGVQYRAAQKHRRLKGDKISDDYTVLYLQPQVHRLAVVGAIDTGPKQNVVLDPRAIVYSDFVNVDGVKFASTWSFYQWSAQNGPFGGMLGQVKLANIRFIKPASDAFTPPPGAAMVKSK